MRPSLFGTRDIGRSGPHQTKRSVGPSWLLETSSWEPDSSSPKGGLAMDPVTFQRLVDYLLVSTHTGMGHATPALTRDTDGLNALAREAAYRQSADHVIGPRHPHYDHEGL